MLHQKCLKIIFGKTILVYTLSLQKNCGVNVGQLSINMNMNYCKIYFKILHQKCLHFLQGEVYNLSVVESLGD